LLAALVSQQGKSRKGILIGTTGFERDQPNPDFTVLIKDATTRNGFWTYMETHLRLFMKAASMIHGADTWLGGEEIESWTTMET
jgi:hypothetical protein